MTFDFRCKTWLAILLAVLLLQAAWAAHPLGSEDTGTQGKGNFKLEHGVSWSRDGDSRSFAYQPQLAYGIGPDLDLLLQPSWLSNRGAEPASATGFGDTAVDAKWRFLAEGPLSLALRAGLLLPTGRQDSGLASGKVSPHATLVATPDNTPWAVHGNLGYARNPGGADVRRNLARASLASTYAATQHWTLAIDNAIEQNPDRSGSSWLDSVLAGAIYTVRQGLEVDVGYQIGWRRDAPARP